MTFIASKIVWSIFYAISLLPFWVLHRLSDCFFVIVYYGIGYRKKVVRQNLKNSFPEKSSEELLTIEKKFYQNLCDLMVESIKTITISPEDLKKRFVLQTPGLTQKWAQEKVNVAGIAGHYGNWEWLALGLALETKQTYYGLYKPLSNPVFNKAAVKSRARFGCTLVPSRDVGKLVRGQMNEPYIMAFVSDQAPPKNTMAIEVQFLNQKTYVVTGAAVISAQKNLKAVWGSVQRVGRSRYTWSMHPLEEGPGLAIDLDAPLNAEDQAQIERIARQHSLTFRQANRALKITQEWSRRLEQQIKMAPQDWLWSHRRWKNR